MEMNFGSIPQGTFGDKLGYTSELSWSGARGWYTCIPTTAGHRAASGELNSQTVQLPVHAHRQYGLRQPENCPPTKRHNAGCWEWKQPETDVHENGKGVPGDMGGGTGSACYLPHSAEHTYTYIRGYMHVRVRTHLCTHTSQNTHPSCWFGFPSSDFYMGFITISAVTPGFRIILSRISVFPFAVITLRIGIIRPCSTVPGTQQVLNKHVYVKSFREETGEDDTKGSSWDWEGEWLKRSLRKGGWKAEVHGFLKIA